jgi:hypothetical protein
MSFGILFLLQSAGIDNYVRLTPTTPTNVVHFARSLELVQVSSKQALSIEERRRLR